MLTKRSYDSHLTFCVSAGQLKQATTAGRAGRPGRSAAAAPRPGPTLLPLLPGLAPAPAAVVELALVDAAATTGPALLEPVLLLLHGNKFLVFEDPVLDLIMEITNGIQVWA